MTQLNDGSIKKNINYMTFISELLIFYLRDILFIRAIKY